MDGGGQEGLGLYLGQRGDRRPPGREEITAAGLRLAVTLTGSDCVGPLQGWTLREENAGRGMETGPSKPRRPRQPCWPCAHAGA